MSDTEAILSEELGEPSPLRAVCQGEFKSYDIIAHLDQGQVFDAVQLALSRGACIGIFPEGGSHDNTDLLPLKVGVAAIALGAQEKYGVSVPIVPVGLTYFRGDRFRGRALVEYGEPLRITRELAQQYKENKRQACQTLLSQVEEGMRAVLVTATDYGELKLLHTTRRLYQRSPSSLSTRVRQDLSRRFSVGLRLLREKGGGALPEDCQGLQKRIEAYQEALDRWGLKDYQVPGLRVTAYSKALLTFLHGFAVFSLASIPRVCAAETRNLRSIVKDSGPSSHFYLTDGPLSHRSNARNNVGSLLVPQCIIFPFEILTVCRMIDSYDLKQQPRSCTDLHSVVAFKQMFC